MFCWLTIFWGIRWTESKVKIIEQEPMKSEKFPYHNLMIKYTSTAMDMMH